MRRGSIHQKLVHVRNQVIGATLLRQMLAGASGPLLSFVVLFAIPLLGALLLSGEQFAMWALLSTISTIALSVDFGGVALTMARIQVEPRGPLLLRAIGLSAIGSALVGVIALGVWIPYSNTAAAGGFSFGEGAAAMAVTALAASLRSALLVLAQVALNDHRFRLRTAMLAGQSLLAALVTVAWLVLWRSAWALPMGWLISCVLVLFAVVPICRRQGLFDTPSGMSPYSDSAAVHRTFAWARSVVSVLSAILQQADRWVVGALGGPAFLGVYEVAWRFATLPRFLIQNLSAVLGGNSVTAAKEGGGHVVALLRRSTRIVAVLGIAGGVGLAVMYWAWTEWLGAPSNWSLFILMALVQLMLGLSAPLSVITLGMGMPKLDIPYMALSVVLSAAAAVAGFVTGHVEIFAYGNLAALSIGLLWFYEYGPRALRARLDHV